jgi:hypothetical protein
MQFLAALLMSVLLWWPGAGVAQQDWEPFPPPFCGELSEADCQLLIDSQEMMRNVSSLRLSMALEAGVTGIPAIAEEDLAFEMQIDTTMHLDPEVYERMRRLAPGMGEDSDEELSDQYAKLGELLVEFYETAAMDMQMQMALPRLLIDAVEQEEGAAPPEQIGLEMRLLDGYMYINMEKLAESSPELRAQLERERMNGWIGFDLVSQIRSDLLRSTSGTAESLQMGMWSAQLMNDEMIRQLLEPYITVQRLDDEERNGEQVAVFRTSLDFARLATRPDFSRLLRILVDRVGELTGEPMNDQEIGLTILGFQMIANVLARSSQFEMIQAIGVDAPYLHRQSFSVRLDFSGLLTFLALAGEELPAELQGARPIFTLDADFRYSDFDAAPPVEKPARARIIPLDSLDQETINLIS